jgi:hypothetical protein
MFLEGIWKIILTEIILQLTLFCYSLEGFYKTLNLSYSLSITFSYVTEDRDQVRSTSTAYLRGPGFKSRPANGLSWVARGFIAPSRQTSG